MKVLVISDIHGNYEALINVIEYVKGYDYILVLGDLVDYGPEPDLVIDFIRSLRPDAIVRGNHDNAVAYNTDCRSSKKIHELSVYTRENITRKLLSRSQILWLASLPVNRVIEIDSIKFYLVHASPNDPLYGYLEPTLSDNEFLKMLRQASGEFPTADIIITGHTHIPIIREVMGFKVLNPGSVGQPRDGIPMASALIIDTRSMKFKVIRVGYDIKKVIEKIRKCGIKERYVEWLSKVLVSARL